MSVSAAVLSELHRLHRQSHDLRSRLERGPRQIKACESGIEKLEQELTQAKEHVLRSRVTADQKELQLREREARIVDIRTKLNSCSTNREYQAFVEQIAADEQANSVLSDEILELLDQIKDEQQEVKHAEARRVKAREELENLRKRLDGERGTLESELGRVNQALGQAESRLPAEFRFEYTRVVKARGEDALAPLEGGCCGGCHQTVTQQMVNELRMSRPVFCKSCGCIIYLPEE